MRRPIKMKMTPKYINYIRHGDHPKNEDDPNKENKAKNEEDPKN